MRFLSRFFIIAAFVFPFHLLAQDDPPIEEEEEDEVDYSLLIASQKNKAYCSSRVLRQSPQKLVSIGYDFQGQHTLTSGAWDSIPEETQNINNVKGIRLFVNYPVFSRNYALLNLGFSYVESNYSFENKISETSHPLTQTLSRNGLRSFGFLGTLFKPLDSRHFFFFQAGVNHNGDYKLSYGQEYKYLRYTGAIIYGLKPNDRKMWGFGMARTYLGGALNYVPIYYLQYSSLNKKWGIEAALPARFQYRRNLNEKNLLFFGYEIEGNSFRLNNAGNPFKTDVTDLELKRAELRFRVTYEYALSRQFWISMQAGYRYNWSFDVDQGDFVRTFFSDKPYLFENNLTNPVYFQVSINWVSP